MLKLTISLCLSIFLLFNSCGQKNMTKDSKENIKTASQTNAKSNTTGIKKGTRFVLKIDGLEDSNASAINTAATILEKRLDDAKLNYNPSKIDAAKNEITVEVASNLNDPKKLALIRDVLTPKRKSLQFLPCYRLNDAFIQKIVATGELAKLGLTIYPINGNSYPSFIGTVPNENLRADIVTYLQQNIAENHMVEYYWTIEGGGHFLHLVDGRNLMLTEKSVDSAVQQVSQYTGMMEVGVTFNAEGAKKFARMTEACATDNNRAIAIIVDDELMSAPMVRAAIPGGKVTITADFTMEEAQKLAMNLDSGNVPFNVSILEEKAME